MTYEDSVLKQQQNRINHEFTIDNRAAVSYSISDREGTNLFFMDTEDLEYEGFISGSTIDEENKYEVFPDEESEVNAEQTEEEQRLNFLYYLKEKGLPYDEKILDKLLQGVVLKELENE